jgi:hypothetical protein
MSVWAHNLCTEQDVDAALARENLEDGHIDRARKQWLVAYANLKEPALLQEALERLYPGADATKLLAVRRALEAAADAPVSRDLPNIPVKARPNGGIDLGDPKIGENKDYFTQMEDVPGH